MTGGGRLAVLSLALAVLGGGCLPEGSVPPPSPSESVAPDPTAFLARAHLGATVWYAGWVLELGTAEASLDAKGGHVRVGLTLRNSGTDEASFDERIRLVSGTSSFEPARETVFPEVAPGAAGSTSVIYDVVGAFDLATASFVVGEPVTHQAVVPLRGDAVVSLEPRPIAKPAKPTNTAGSLRLTVTGGEIRADLPDWGLELHRDRLALKIAYDATYRGTFAGGAAFTADNVVLVLPDGRRVSPRRDGRSQSNVVLKAGATQKGLVSRFEIPTPAGGQYRLVVRDGTAQAAILLVIPTWR